MQGTKLVDLTLQKQQPSALDEKKKEGCIVNTVQWCLPYTSLHGAVKARTDGDDTDATVLLVSIIAPCVQPFKKC